MPTKENQIEALLVGAFQSNPVHRDTPVVTYRCEARDPNGGLSMFHTDDPKVAGSYADLGWRVRALGEVTELKALTMRPEQWQKTCAVQLLNGQCVIASETTDKSAWGFNLRSSMRDVVLLQFPKPIFAAMVTTQHQLENT